jgi:pyridoxal phosphate enzyme (YggS family)
MVLHSRDAILANLAEIRANIAGACDRVSRDPADVRLVAATKTVTPEAIRWAHEAGVADFGENYVRELRDKRIIAPDATWHFIGTLQSHTAHHVADLADVVETVTPGRAVVKLARRAAEQGKAIPALIEVDFTASRTGVSPEACESFAEDVVSMPGIDLVGLMTLPPLPVTPEDSRPYFRELRELLARVAARQPRATQLSMGMSMDYPVAVEEGATMVRIGTALFGERPPVN